jgi:hypothetical protein
VKVCEHCRGELYWSADHEEWLHVDSYRNRHRARPVDTSPLNAQHGPVQTGERVRARAATEDPTTDWSPQ